MFRIGDIVQAQISFVVIPIKGGRRKMLSVLRSLALLDGNFSMVCDIRTKFKPFLNFWQYTTRQPAIAIEGAPKLQRLKWKIGYDEVNEEAEKRLAEKRIQTAMEVDQEAEAEAEWALKKGPGKIQHVQKHSVAEHEPQNTVNKMLVSAFINMPQSMF